MVDIIIAFRSRTESIRFNDFLKTNGIPAILVNTPRELNIGCGVASQINEKYYNNTQHLLNFYNQKSSYVGIFQIQKSGVRKIITKM